MSLLTRSKVRAPATVQLDPIHLVAQTPAVMYF